MRARSSRPTVVLLAVPALLAVSAVANAEEPPPAAPPPAPAREATPFQPSQSPPPWPRVGGHFGLAFHLVSIDNDGTIGIGADYVQIGVTPGIKVKITQHWLVDFEFIAWSRWDLNPPGVPNKSHTIFLVDPGVVYDFGKVAAGLRLAVQIGEGIPLNYGLIPIVVVPFPINKALSYFLELDLPVFVTGRVDPPPGGEHVLGSLSVVLQSGFAF